MISTDASYILMPQFKKKSKSSVWSSPPTKLPWNQKSEKFCLWVSPFKERWEQVPEPPSLSWSVACQPARQLAKGWGRREPATNPAGICQSHTSALLKWKCLCKPFWFQQASKFYCTEIGHLERMDYGWSYPFLYSYEKKYSWEFSWPALLSWSHRQIFFPRPSSDVETCTALCKQIHLLSKPNILFLHCVFSIEEALKATQSALKWQRLKVLVLWEVWSLLWTICWVHWITPVIIPTWSEPGNATALSSWKAAQRRWAKSVSSGNIVKNEHQLSKQAGVTLARRAWCNLWF